MRVDEKSQIQALDRNSRSCRCLPGMPERRTHDYKRHGTTSLFAALDVATGHRQVLQAPPGQGVSRFLTTDAFPEGDRYRCSFPTSHPSNTTDEFHSNKLLDHDFFR